MFEKSKFQKKYPILLEYYLDNILQMKSMIKNKEIYDFYNNNKELINNYINILKPLYSSEEITKFLTNHFNKLNESKLKEEYNCIKEYINLAKTYNNGDINILKEITYEEMITSRIHTNDIENKVIDLCFKKYYKDKITIKGIDIYEIYKTIDSINLKKKLLDLCKNNNLECLAFIIESLSKYNIQIENLEELFKREVDKNIFNKEIKNILGEENYISLFIYFFNTSSNDKERINQILEQKNYELIKDMLLLKENGKFSKNINENEVNNDIFSIKNISASDISYILQRYMGSSLGRYRDYLNNLKISLKDEKKYEEFYNRHKKVIDLLNCVYYENYKKISVEEQKKIYSFIKNLTNEEKEQIKQEVEKISKEIEELYKEEYASYIKNANGIIEKASPSAIQVNDKTVDNIKYYELKDNESFNFMITVMHNLARGGITPNMYGRPAHKITIDNPENFKKDLPGGSEVISTSLINDRNIETFIGYDVDLIYVFSDIKASDIVCVSPTDAAYSPQVDESKDLFSGPFDKEPCGPEELMRKTKDYNELVIRRKNINGERNMPTAILCYDKVNEESIRHAQYYDIPIIVINTKTYKYLQGVTEEKEETNGFKI